MPVLVLCFPMDVDDVDSECISAFSPPKALMVPSHRVIPIQHFVRAAGNAMEVAALHRYAACLRCLLVLAASPVFIIMD